MSFTKDDKGIWRTNKKKEVSYPGVGNDDSFLLEEKSFWFNYRNSVIETVQRNYPFDGDFADIGGGNGFQLMKIKKNNENHSNILIEPGYNGCLNARKREIDCVYNMTFEEFDFSKFKLKGVSFFDVIEHIEDDVSFLKALYSKIEKGTKIYITVPAYNRLWSDVDDYGGHFRRYNLKMVKKLALDSGYKLIYFNYFFSHLTLISYFLRALPYKLGKRKAKEKIMENETSQHSPKGIVKNLFDLFERRELKRIKNGRTIAHGASCIFILEK
jgi:hypothetical protein